MKLERITQNKIKITLTGEEMIKWNLDIEKISSNAPEAKEFFLSVIERAERELNFQVRDSQLLVEAVMRNDLSVIHISKILPDSEDYHKLEKGRIKRIEIHKRNKPDKSKGAIYKFNTLDNVIDACKLIKNDIVEDSTLYKLDNCFYIYITDIFSFDKQTQLNILEFAAKVDCDSSTLGKLNEYGEVIIHANAIQTLAKL